MPFVMTVKKGKVNVNGRECEDVDIKGTMNGSITWPSVLAILDEHYLTVPKEYEKMHVELFAIFKDMAKVNELYDYLLRTDGFRKKSMVVMGDIPFYIVDSLLAILSKHRAMSNVNGLFRKVEKFTRFLLLRSEEMHGEAASEMKLKDTSTIMREEERDARKYSPPTLDEIKNMSYEMLTDEIAKAKSMFARKRVMDLLIEARKLKLRAKVQKKSEHERMMDIARETDQDVDEDVPDFSHTKAAKGARRKERVKERVKEEYIDNPDEMIMEET